MFANNAKYKSRMPDAAKQPFCIQNHYFYIRMQIFYHYLTPVHITLIKDFISLIDVLEIH